MPTDSGCISGVLLVARSLHTEYVTPSVFGGISDYLLKTASLIGMWKVPTNLQLFSFHY